MAASTRSNVYDVTSNDIKQTSPLGDVLDPGDAAGVRRQDSQTVSEDVIPSERDTSAGGAISPDAISTDSSEDDTPERAFVTQSPQIPTHYQRT